MNVGKTTTEDGVKVTRYDPPASLGAFESDVITYIVQTQQPALAPLLGTLLLTEKHYNGHGMYFETTSDKFRLKTQGFHNEWQQIGYIPLIETPQLEDGFGAILYFKDYEIRSLELYGFGRKRLPEEITEWAIA